MDTDKGNFGEQFSAWNMKSIRQDRDFIKERLHGKVFEVESFGAKYKIRLAVTYYPADTTVAIQATCSGDGFPEPFGVLTVCIPPFGESLEEREILVKGWSENEQWTKSLLQRYPDVFERTEKGVRTGFVTADVWRIK